MIRMDSASRLRRLAVRAPFYQARRIALAAALAIVVVPLVLAPVASAHRRHRARRHAARTAGTEGCVDANSSVTRTPTEVLRQAVVCLVNAQRTARGLPSLRDNARLDRSAQGWTDAMVSQDMFGHGPNFASRISAAGYDWSTAGENIATGFPTPAGVVRAWMASPDHCRNILTPTFAAIGAGISRSGVTGYGGVGTWTLDFGLWMG